MVSLYDLSVPVYIRTFENLINVLKVGEKWAIENNVQLDKLLDEKLAPDMKPLSYQIQSASNTAKAILPRIAGQEDVTMEDNESTYQALYDRIQKTIDVLNTAKPENFLGKEDSEVSLFDGRFKSSALKYLQAFGLPNFFFHVTTAYDILRNQGAPVGKMDFLGRE